MSSLMFFRHDWRSAWIVIINPFVVVCRRYLSIGEDAWLQPYRMTILRAFYCWGSEMVMQYNSWAGCFYVVNGFGVLNSPNMSKHAQESTISVCLLYGNYSDSCLQLDIFCTFGVDTTPRNTVEDLKCLKNSD